MNPCPTSTTSSLRPARAVSSAAACAARARAAPNVSTPGDQPQIQADRATKPHIAGGRRTPARNLHGSSASRNSASTSVAASVGGTSSAADSRARRSGLVKTHRAARTTCSSAGPGRDAESRGAASSPRRHAANARPAIGVRKSHAGRPCRTRMILTQVRERRPGASASASRARRSQVRAARPPALPR